MHKILERIEASNPSLGGCPKWAKLKEALREPVGVAYADSVAELQAGKCQGIAVWSEDNGERRNGYGQPIPTTPLYALPPE